MVVEQSIARIPASPTGSGRASPVPGRWRNPRGEDENTGRDKVYRRYAAGVVRSLSLFDTALQEWADYISFLGRLLKSLQAHPPTINAVPSKHIVSKRLAQCLNPSLPSGVHQKTLEVYSFIFSMIGSEALSRDLPLYLPGLSATLSFASLSVRSPFLTLLETHILKADPTALRPALKAIILALLPGLEEETSEEFERTLKLLNGFKDVVRPEDGETATRHSQGDQYFWQCFFLASITSKSRRLGALAYLTRNLPRLGQSLSRRFSIVPGNDSYEDDAEASSDQLVDAVTSPEPGLLLRCFAAGLGDDQLLIQRGFLDLLVSHVPLHAKVLQDRVKPEDLELLLTAASGVVVRRDMSLNRRLWAWLLGPEPVAGDADVGPESPSSVNNDQLTLLNSGRTRYFEAFGLKSLIRAILNFIKQDQLNPAERARPFRICLSFMDRWEIGGLVVPELFLPIVASTKRYEDQALTRSDFTEVLKSASVFFDGVESGLIWGELNLLIAQSLGSNEYTIEDRLEKLSLVDFTIAHFNVREEEMLTIHAPLTLMSILTLLQNARDSNSLKKPDSESNDVTKSALRIASEIIDMIPERAFIHPARAARPAQLKNLADLDTDDILKKIQVFYSQDQGNLDAAQAPFSAEDICILLLRATSQIVSYDLNSPDLNTAITMKTRLLVTLSSKSPKVKDFETAELTASISKALSTTSKVPFANFSAIVSIVTTLHPMSYISSEDLSSLVDALVRLAWFYLDPSCPKYHVETVRNLWQLQAALTFDNRDIEASLCQLIVEGVTSGTFAQRGGEPGQKFGLIWTHTLLDNSGHLDRRGSKTTNGDSSKASSATYFAIMLTRPLFLLLDALDDERTQLFTTVRTWLSSMVGIDRLFHLFIEKLSVDSIFLQISSHDKIENTSDRGYNETDDLDQCTYVLQTLSNVLRWSSDLTWDTLAQNVISTDKSHGSLHRITNRDGEISLQEFFLHVCLRALAGRHRIDLPCSDAEVQKLHRISLSVLQQILLSPFALSLADLEVEIELIDRLNSFLGRPDPLIQVPLLDALFAALKLRYLAAANIPQSPKKSHKRVKSQDSLQGRRSSTTIGDELSPSPSLPPPPSSLIKCIQAGISTSESRTVLDSWIAFLIDCLPYYAETIFQIILPLVATLCEEIAKTFDNLQKTFRVTNSTLAVEPAPETVLISLLNGLEQVLARGHDKLLRDEAITPAAKSPEQPQGFFGNMVSGVFAAEQPLEKSLTANNRLTVLLTFQDAVRICFLLWSWGGQGIKGESQDVESAASFNFTSLRMRNRARRLLEHLFAAEALECLETVVDIWQKSIKNGQDQSYAVVFNLLHVLDGSRPKHTIPAIFNAIYSRTNPNALEAARKSTLTSTLLDTDIVAFLVEYAKSLEDDAMDEIWIDCMTFLRDILANPFPHRQTLSSLLEFAAILGEKVDNTNFGEQRKMRKELADLFLRLLTAMFTTKPIGFHESASQVSITDSASIKEERASTIPSRLSIKPENVVGILAFITPNLSKILVEPDRVLNAANTISTSVIGPTFRSKAFPENVSNSTLTLLYQLARLQNTQKFWRKEISDVFNDSRFFGSSIALVESGWLPLLRLWSLSDKERMSELLTRLTPPTTAGIVFGVGATSARLEADRKTQLNLRRLATLIMAAADDTFAANLKGIEEKLVELLSATATTSPSSVTRAEVYMVLRALALKISPVHLALLWPVIDSELQSALDSAVAPDHSALSETYNNYTVLQACKLLDMLLCIAPDDFQLHEWLYITDTVDAIYRPVDFKPMGQIDQISEELGAVSVATTSNMDATTVAASKSPMRRPLLGAGGISDDVNLERKDELVGKILRPFFSQLSIFAFESTYSMGTTDLEACKKDLLKDLFDERSIVKAL